MELQLTGKTALVTGASRGIGLAVVQTLIAEGVRVAGVCRNPTPELAETGALPIAADLSEPGGAERAVAEGLAGLGGLDILVNNAGGGDGGLSEGFLDITDTQWSLVVDLNLLATVRVTRAALPELLTSRGAIVNISSISAQIPHGGPTPYATAKAGLNALGKALAEEFGPSGVRVNTVSPGAVRTALWESPDGYGAGLAASLGVPHDDFLAGVPAATGMHIDRLIEPEEVAAVVTYLASPRAAATTGADHRIDGGSVKTV